MLVSGRVTTNHVTYAVDPGSDIVADDCVGKTAKNRSGEWEKSLVVHPEQVVLQ